MSFRREVEVRPNGLESWIDELSGELVSEIDDNSQFDVLRIKVELIHKNDIGDQGIVLQQAGANYQFPYQQLFTDTKHLASLVYVLTDKCQKLANEAVQMVIDDVIYRSGHRHIKHSVSPRR